MNSALPTAHNERLTYCTNIHPGETLAEVCSTLTENAAKVAAHVLSDVTSLADFPLGLRLSARATDELQAPEKLAQFQTLLKLHKLRVLTLNGFPFGAFHGQPVKENVYLPDWTSPERLRYTRQLFATMAALLAPNHYGSVSTVPGQFKAHEREGSRSQIARQLLSICADLVEWERSHGVEMVLALEPEPGCLLETTAETLAFFESELLGQKALNALSYTLDVDIDDAERLLRRHLGVCLDTCHAAVEFESALGAYQSYTAAGIRVGKVQISAGLEFLPQIHDPLRLASFAESVYLHQVVKQTATGLRRFDDLPLALADATRNGSADDERWRVHFHVPLFTDQYGDFSSTRADIVPLLHALGETAQPPHLEVETYTWNVLPEAFRDRPIAEAIAAELEWTRQQLLAGNRAT